MSTDLTKTAEAIQRLKSEIESLRTQHSEALKAATYLGISSRGAKLQEDRRAEITKLVDELARLVEELSRTQ